MLRNGISSLRFLVETVFLPITKIVWAYKKTNFAQSVLAILVTNKNSFSWKP